METVALCRFRRAKNLSCKEFCPLGFCPLPRGSRCLAGCALFAVSAEAVSAEVAGTTPLLAPPVSGGAGETSCAVSGTSLGAVCGSLLITGGGL